MPQRSKLARRYGHFKMPAVIRKHPTITEAVLGASIAITAPMIQASAGLLGAAVVGAVAAVGITEFTGKTSKGGEGS